VAMAHSVEIRVPFLDYRVIECMSTVPSRWKILGLNEKHLLKKILTPVLPESVCRRRKQPYRAPIVDCLLSEPVCDGVRGLLGRSAIESAGLFDAAKVARLLGKVQTVDRVSEVDGMALAGILSTQIIHRLFVEQFRADATGPVRADLTFDRRGRTAIRQIDRGSVRRTAIASKPD